MVQAQHRRDCPHAPRADLRYVLGWKHGPLWGSCRRWPHQRLGRMSLPPGEHKASSATRGGFTCTCWEIIGCSLVSHVNLDPYLRTYRYFSTSPAGNGRNPHWAARPPLRGNPRRFASHMATCCSSAEGGTTLCWRTSICWTSWSVLCPIPSAVHDGDGVASY